MRSFRARSLSLGFISFFATLASAPAFAALDVSRLEQARDSANTAAARAAYEAQAKDFSAATCFSVLHSQDRAKLPGAFRPYFDLGFHAFKVKNDSIRLLVDSSGSTPDFFHGVTLRAGIGMPFGFAIEGGMTQVVNDHSVAGIYLSASNQVLDFANIVYIDLVPSMTLSGTVMRTADGPQLYAFTGQSVIGAYNRVSHQQFGFILQYTYSLLTAIDPAIGTHFYRYGFMTQVPIYKGSFVKMQAFYPSVSLELAMGYQF